MKQDIYLVDLWMHEDDGTKHYNEPDFLTSLNLLHTMMI